MIRILKISAPACLVCLFVFEIVLLFAVFHLGLTFTWFEFDFSIGQFLQDLPKAALFVGVTGLFMFVFGLYAREAVVSTSVAIPRLLAAFAAAILVLSLVFYNLPAATTWRGALIPAMLIAFIGIFVTRRFGHHIFDSHLLKRRIAVFGTGVQAARIEALSREAFASFTCVGYLPIDGEVIEVPTERLLSPTNNVAELLRQRRVEEIVIATKNTENLPTHALIDCRRGGVKIGDYETFHCHETSRVDLDFLAPDWLFVEGGFDAARLDRWGKRTLDIVLGGILLLMMAPLFAIIALAIKLGDGGPIFYSQERVGRGGKIFQMTKFRSMRVDAESDGVPRWAGLHDSRVTRVGQILRASHLDELPQLWGVLKGDMSFVGPRPERPYFVQQLAEAHPYYQDRHAIKPGLTGLAVIKTSYARTLADHRHRLEYDLYYVRYGNILLDAVILLQTVRIVLWPSASH